MTTSLWIAKNCRFAQGTVAGPGRNPPTKGQYVTIPGDPTVIFIDQRPEQGQLATGERWWTARGTNERGERVVLKHDDQAIKDRGWATHRGPEPEYFAEERKRKQRRREEEEQTRRVSDFRERFRMKVNTLLDLKDEASSHPELGAFVGHQLRVTDIDYAEPASVTACVADEPDLCVTVTAAELSSFAEPSLPPTAAALPVRTPYGETLGDLVNGIPSLADMVAAGKTGAQAIVYVNANHGRGWESFVAHMKALGQDADALTEGMHYTLNHAPTPMSPWSGKVFIQTDSGELPPEVRTEVAPLLEAALKAKGKESETHVMPDGTTLWWWSNPLFRAVVGLGAWS